MSEHFKLARIPTVLEGDANLKYWECTEEEHQNWNNLIKVLSAKFAPESNRATFQAALEGRHRRKDESLDAYMSAIKSLAREAFPEWDDKYRDIMVRKYFTDRLEETLKIWVLQANPKTAEALVALRTEANLNKKQSATANMANSQQSINTTDLAEAITIALEKRGIGYTSTARVMLVGNMVIFGVIWNVLNRHKIRKRARDGSTGTGELSSLVKLFKSLPQNVYVSRLVNNDLKVLGLVDTGAQITIVNEEMSLLDELQIKVELEQTNLTITGPSKSYCLDIKGIANLSMEIAGYVVYWPTYVCTNLSQSLLIGKDLLKAYNAVIDLGSDTLRLNGNSAELHYSQTLDVFNVNVGHTVIIPARTVANIACSVNSGHCNDGYTGVLEPANLFEKKYQTGIIKVVATCHEGKIPVRVFNPKS